MRTTAAIAAFALLLGGCTSLQPVDLPPQEVRGQVRDGQIVRLGERVSLTADDGTTHVFEVLEVTDLAVRGDAVDVPIDSIVSVRTTQADPARTALAVGGVLAVVYVAAALDAVDEIIEAITD